MSDSKSGGRGAGARGASVVCAGAASHAHELTPSHNPLPRATPRSLTLFFLALRSYVIPTPVIAHFLDDFRRNDTFTGFPALGIQWQRMESEALR